jgi:hypothetical protein
MQPFEFTYKGVNVEVGSDFIRFRGASAGKKGVEIEEELMEMLGHRISLSTKGFPRGSQTELAMVFWSSKNRH